MGIDMKTEAEKPRRVLVVDDNEAIHSDFQKILVETSDSHELDTLEAMFHQGNRSVISEPRTTTVLHTASQGATAVEMVKESVAKAEPYDVAFVDMRMPPGLDGVETISQMHRADIDLQVVLCTAYTDYSWHSILDRLGTTDRLLVLKKPFDAVEVLQMVAALVEKRRLTRCKASNMDKLEQQVSMRTKRLTQALKDISYTSNEKSRFMSAFSQQFIQPLQSILDHATSILRGNGEHIGAQDHVDLTEIADHGKVLLNMTGILLDTAQIEAGSAQLKLSSVDISTMFASVLKDVEPIANERAFAVSLSVNPSVPKLIQSDPNRLRVLLRGLLESVILFSNLDHTHLFVDNDYERDEIQCRLVASGPYFASVDTNELPRRPPLSSLELAADQQASAIPLAPVHRLAQLLGGSITVVESQLDEYELFLNMPSNPPANSTTGLGQSPT